MRLLPWLDPMRNHGRKGRELGPWRAAVEEVDRARWHGCKPRAEIIEAAAARLQVERRYSPTRLPPVQPSRDPLRETIAALLRWAQTQRGPLSSAVYERDREADPSLPHRNTVARRFGSWEDALAAAGLNGRAATPRAVRNARLAGGAAGRARRRQRQCARVLAAVRSCAEDIGRLPAAMEFFAWQLEHAPDTPTQATVYRVFPGGWSAVVAALGSSSAGQPSAARVAFGSAETTRS